MSTLHDARLQLHYAARFLASAAHSMLPHADDDSHTALQLAHDDRSLETGVLHPDGVTLCLSMPALSLEWRLGDHVVAGTALAGMRMGDGFDWLNGTRPPETAQIAERTFPDFPEHKLAAGGRFDDSGTEARTQLAAEFTRANQALRNALRDEPGASPLRVWPHHFDLGALLPLGDTDRMIGLGFSPGDDSYDEPYYYVSPYPRPDSDALPSWSGPGHWHTSGFTSLILTATERDGRGADRHGAPATVASYLTEALRMARGLMT